MGVRDPVTRMCHAGKYMHLGQQKDNRIGV